MRQQDKTKKIPSRARSIKLADPDGRIACDAGLRLYAHMLFPNSPGSRRSFMDALLSQTESDMPDSLTEAFRQGAICGDLVVSLLQLHLHGERVSIARALPFVRASILFDAGGFDRLGRQGPLELQTGEFWHRIHDDQSFHFGEAYLRTALDQFRRVAHIWAAVVIAEFAGPQTARATDGCSLLETEDGLLELVALATNIREQMSTVTVHGSNPSHILHKRFTSPLIVPKGSPVRADFGVPPVSPIAMEYVTGRRKVSRNR